MTWTADLYDDVLADMLLERADPDATLRTLAFLRDVLELGPGVRILDQCCGIGSLAIPLAQQGYEVVGVDQAPHYIARAAAAAAAVGVHVELVTADATRWVPARPCEAAINWNTSFAHAERDDDNLAMLARAFESLAPNGRFALDFMNLPQVLRDFQAHVSFTRDTPRGRVTLVRDSSFDLAAGYMLKTWNYELPDGQRRTRTSRLRLYMPHQLVEMLRAVGFVSIELFGSELREPLAMTSGRCIAVARKAPA